MADILVKDSDWNSISVEMQSQIQDIVAQQLPGTTIVPDPGGIALTGDIPDDTSQVLSTGANAGCVENCNTARDVATAACMALGDLKAVALCTVATQIVAAGCRALC
jgi:hypothetical protein